MKVRDVMSYPIATVPPETTVLEAIRLMARGKKGCVLVATDGLLKECKGILTMSQIFSRVFAEGKDPSRLSVVDVMTPAPLITIGLNASTKEAAGLMIKHKIRRLPVMENGMLVGIVTSKDLLQCVE